VSKTSVLYLVTEPWYFANHRLDHATALIADGFEVHVATRRGERWDDIVAAGCPVHEIDMARGSGSVGGWIREIRTARRIVRQQRPDVVHAVALKPLAIAISMLAMRHRPALILSVNGLGISAAERGLRIKVIRIVIRAVRRFSNVWLLFQTAADQRAILGSNNEGVVIPGVGVDTAKFVPLERPSAPPCVVVYLGRAVKSKGLQDLAAAFDSGDMSGVELHLYCALDSSSPGALSTEELTSIERTSGITLHEPTSEPELVLGRAHAAILASRAGEGVSKFVLEALACGTPVLLSGESGSAEVIEPGTTGAVFEAGDPESIRSALRELLSWSPERRAEVQVLCRAAAEQCFALDVILPQIVALHRRAASGANS
jgi:glycosyltransferase involved in cell wall biosynthesis